MSQISTNTPARGAVAKEERSIAPDLARGMMLLLIAIAHVPLYIQSSGPRILSQPQGGGLLDSIIQFATILFVDLRSYPMFATLFGYGLAMIVMRQLAAGSSEQMTRKIIKRRCLYMLLFGAVHALFVFSFDILSVYGLVGLLFGSLLFAKGKKILRVIAWCSVIIICILILKAWLTPGIYGNPMQEASTLAGSAGEAAVKRAIEYVIWLIISLVGFPMIIPILFGVWAGQRRLLDAQQLSKGLLKKVSIIGISVSIAGGLPLAATVLGWWPPSSYYVSLHAITGVFGGIGYVAVFGLIAARIRTKESHGKVVQALVATGQRSLTNYLLQSVILLLGLSAWGLGLGKSIHSWWAFVFAVFTWLINVALSVYLERRKHRGPAESLLRKLVYKKSYDQTRAL